MYGKIQSNAFSSLVFHGIMSTLSSCLFFRSLLCLTVIVCIRFASSLASWGKCLISFLISFECSVLAGGRDPYRLLSAYALFLACSCLSNLSISVRSLKRSTMGSFTACNSHGYFFLLWKLVSMMAWYRSCRVLKSPLGWASLRVFIIF